MKDLILWHIWLQFPADSKEKFDGYFLTDDLDGTIDIIEKTHPNYLCVYYQAC